MNSLSTPYNKIKNKEKNAGIQVSFLACHYIYLFKYFIIVYVYLGTTGDLRVATMDKMLSSPLGGVDKITHIKNKYKGKVICSII